MIEFTVAEWGAVKNGPELYNAITLANSDKIVPISVDDEWRKPTFRIVRGGTDLAPHLRERNFVDFVNLSYKEGLERLIEALRWQ